MSHDGNQASAIDFLSHDAGQLLEVMFGRQTNPHFGRFHQLSALFIGGGFWLNSPAWPVLYAAQRAGTLARTGVYANAREEAGMRARHGQVYDDDAARTPRFVPVLALGRRKPAG